MKLHTVLLLAMAAGACLAASGEPRVTDLTKPGDWFWWHKRVENAGGQTLTFEFPSYRNPCKACIGSLGPAVSRDGEKTWSWLGPTTNRTSFTYAFAPDEQDVSFAFSMPYRLEDWPYPVRQLTTSLGGRAVPYMRFGATDRPRCRLFFTARHHACETAASFVLEGLAGALLTNAWIASNAEVTVVPFMDVDGVANGEQGKGRKPHDHNRDYGMRPLYAEPEAFRKLALAATDGETVPSVFIDFHCPLAVSRHHERIFSFGPKEPEFVAAWNRYRALLEAETRGEELVYDSQVDFPYGTGANVDKNYVGDGTTESSTRWFASHVPGCLLAFSQEIGYARAGGVVMPDSARALGRAMARAVLRLVSDGVSETVCESARAIPVAADVDVVVAGGTAEGVAAALAARAAGASVFLAGGFPYLGEDMAGTLELACDPSSAATELEKTLRAAVNDYAGYSYAQPPGFRYPGGWQYHNDPQEKFSISAPPHNPGDSVLYTNAAPIVCTLDEEAELARVEVVTIENADPAADAYVSVDHRGILAHGTRGPLTGRVVLTFLDGPQAGETCELVREPHPLPVGGKAVRDGEPSAVRAADQPPSGRSGQLAVTFAAAVTGRVHRVRVDVSPAPGAVCHLVSRIRFRRAQSVQTVADPSPLKVKQTFDAALLRAGVRFLTGAPVSDLLVDAQGRPSGIVIANRSGRQAVRARAVVDATMYRTLSHLGARSPALGGVTTFSRIIVAAEPPAGEGLSVEELPETHRISGQKPGRVYRCTLALPTQDGSYAGLAAAEWAARERTWTPTTFDAADLLMPVPTRPLGERIRRGTERGRDAAAAARARTAFAPEEVTIAGRPAVADSRVDTREPLGGLRPYDRTLARAVVKQSARALPVFGTYDTVVVGAGTAGVPAALGAARRGARTLAVEYLHVLGGVGTEGMILGYYDGNRCGFTQEFMLATRASDARVGHYQAAETWRRFCREAGVTVWFGAFGEGAYVENGTVKGVVVVTPFGRGVVLAKNVVDATGDADIAAAAGAGTEFLGAKEFALQSAGMAPHRLGRGTVNSDFGFVNDPCAWDLWLFGVRARAGAPDSWDLAQLADSRERRRIVPDLRLEGWDVVTGRKFPDTLVQAYSRQDSHGYLQDDYCYVAEVDGTRKRSANVPLRSYLPRGISNLAVVGLGKGVARDVVPITRMKADMMNEGYAIGLCAAEAVKSGNGDFRAIDVKCVQRGLVRKGNLREEVLDWTADPEVTDAELQAAAASLGIGLHGTAPIMRCPDRARPFIRAAFADAKTEDARQACARVLGMLGDPVGASVLADALTGKVTCVRLRQGACYGGEEMDRIGLPLALGRTRAPCAREPLLRLLEAVDPVRGDLRDVRAVTLSLEALADPVAAEPLARKLATPGLCGWARANVSDLPPQGGYGLDDEMDRCLRELAYARALLACGDYEGCGQAVYESYARDARGTLAEHANAVLSSRTVDALGDRAWGGGRVR